MNSTTNVGAPGTAGKPGGMPVGLSGMKPYGAGMNQRQPLARGMAAPVAPSYATALSRRRTPSGTAAGGAATRTIRPSATSASMSSCPGAAPGASGAPSPLK